MSTVRVYSTVDRLERDLIGAARKSAAELRNVIQDGIRVGNQVAKDFARQSSGSHGNSPFPGKARYPESFTTEMRPEYYHGFAGGGNIYSGEYGPDIAYPMGGMEFEYGSRNQPPHLDLNKSADLIGPAMPGEVRAVLDRVFW